jgi:hypothetical protein
MRVDYDFHPDEDTVRVFRTPPRGVVRLDDEVAVTEALYDGVVLRHYAFADRWYKINLTIDHQGQPIDTGPAELRFAFNCDIATPMERDGDTTYGVDLFVDVLVMADAATYMVGDEDEFADAVTAEMLSPAEAASARAGLDELLAMIRGNELVEFLDAVAPLGPCDPPIAPPMERAPIPDRLQPRLRSSWDRGSHP